MPQIQLQLKPGGATCNHVRILSERGQVLRTLTIPELRDPVSDRDDMLLAQVKRVIRDSGLTDPTLIKSTIELRDFDY